MGIGQVIKLLAAIVTALALTACSATFRDHGYIPPQKQLDGLMVGVDTRDTVRAAVGGPSTEGLLTESAWYYTQSRFRQSGMGAAEEVDRQVVAISFDDKGLVENIEHFGLDQGRVIVLSRRVTDSNVKGISFLRQLFGNFGRIDVASLL